MFTFCQEILVLLLVSFAVVTSTAISVAHQWFPVPEPRQDLQQLDRGVRWDQETGNYLRSYRRTQTGLTLGHLVRYPVDQPVPGSWCEVPARTMCLLTCLRGLLISWLISSYCSESWADPCYFFYVVRKHRSDWYTFIISIINSARHRLKLKLKFGGVLTVRQQSCAGANESYGAKFHVGVYAVHYELYSVSVSMQE